MNTEGSVMLWVVLFGCGDAEKADSGAAVTETGAPDETTPAEVDADADGYPVSEDCDDSDASVNPGVDEVCDGVDNDCDGSIDEGVLTIFYADADADGYGSEDAAEVGCEPSEGHVATSGDCDDTNSDINPDAVEVCDGVDNDCDGGIDRPAVDDAFFYADSDGDGYGDPGSRVASCTAPSGMVGNALDCDDTDAGISPDVAEGCTDGIDNDCDGLTDCEDGGCMTDAACEEDCTDGIDNDTNGLTDCEDAVCWWLDGCDHPAGVYVSVLGGDAEISHRVVSGGESGGWWSRNEWHEIDASSVWGTVRVLPEGVASWAGATTSTVCSWGADRVVGGSSSSSGSGGSYEQCGVSRGNFWIDPGCRLSTSGFLPGGLALSGTDVHSCSATWFSSWTLHIGTQWYAVSLSSSGTNQASSPATSSADSYRYSQETWYQAAIIGRADLLVFP